MRAGEADEVVSLFRGHYNIPADPCRCARTVPGAAGGRQRSRTEAQDHRRRLHRCVRQGKPQGRRRGIPGPGHALSRRDRKRLGHRRALRHHQEPSQCRRLAGLHEAQAGRTVARIVQGRSARAWAASWACRRPLSAAIPFPGPGLAIRVPGEITEDKLEILRKADVIYLDEIRKAGLVRQDLAGLCRAACRSRPWA